MSLTVQVRLSGLIAYARHEDGTGKRNSIDALLVAGALTHHEVAHGLHHGAPGGAASGDAHVASLAVATHHVLAGSSAPDYVLDAGQEEYAVWRLEGTVVDVRVDGQAPAGHVSYDAGPEQGELPSDKNAGSLHWLPSIGRATGLVTAFRTDCLPPAPNPRLVTCAVRMQDGMARALWTDPRHKEEIWELQAPGTVSRLLTIGGPPPYRQALADGLEWSIDAVDGVELLLRSTTGMPVRSIQIEQGKEDTSRRLVTVAITNKAGTIGGGSVFGPPTALDSHFGAFYELVEPTPGMRVRRVPGRVPSLTRTNRCPGSAA